MTTPAGNQDNVVIDLLARLNIDTTAAKKQLEEMFATVARAAGAGAGAAGSGAGGAKVNESGEVKANSERSKARTDALKHLAQQFPGGGLMTSMASAFKGGGMMAGVATGITAAVSILTNIMKSSQVFQTLAGTVFKVLGFMADMFLMPFIPMMMKFVQWMLTHMPQIQEAGEKVAYGIEKLVDVFGFVSRLLGFGGDKEKKSSSMSAFIGLPGAGAWSPFAGSGDGGGGGGPGMFSRERAGWIGEKYLFGMQLGGRVPGGAGAAVPSMLHGGEIVVPQDIAAAGKGMSGRVAAWIERFQQKEMGPSGVMGKWYDSMFGNSILPDIWNSIRGMMVGIEGESEATMKQTASATEAIDEDSKSFWDKLKFWNYLGDIWGCIKDFFGGIGRALAGIFDGIELPDINIGEIMGSIGKKLGEIYDSIMSFFTETIPQWYDNAIAYIKSLPGRLFSGAVNAGKFIWECMKRVWEIVEGFWGMLGNWWDNTIDFIKNLPGNIISGAINAGAFIGACFKRAWGAVSGFFTNTVFPWLGDTAASIGRAAVSAWGYVGNVAGTVADCFGRAKDATVNFFKNTLPGWASSAASGISAGISRLGGIGSSIWSGVTSAMSSARSAITGAIAGWGKSILNWRPFSAFGNLASGHLIYPAAVKTVVPAGGGWIVDPFEEDIPPEDPEKDPEKDPGKDPGKGPGKDPRKDPGGTSTGPQGDSGDYSSGSYWDDPDPEPSKPSPSRATDWNDSPMDNYDMSWDNFGSIGRGGYRGASRRTSSVMRIRTGPSYNQRSTRILNVQINSNLSVAEIVDDIDRLESMTEASFFNGVM